MFYNKHNFITKKEIYHAKSLTTQSPSDAESLKLRWLGPPPVSDSVGQGAAWDSDQLLGAAAAAALGNPFWEPRCSTTGHPSPFALFPPGLRRWSHWHLCFSFDHDQRSSSQKGARAPPRAQRQVCSFPCRPHIPEWPTFHTFLPQTTGLFPPFPSHFPTKWPLGNRGIYH